MTAHFAEAFKASRQRGAERLVAGWGPANLALPSLLPFATELAGRTALLFFRLLAHELTV